MPMSAAKLYELSIRFGKTSEIELQTYCPFCNIGYFDGEVRPSDCNYCKGKCKNASVLIGALDVFVEDIFEELSVAVQIQDKKALASSRKQIAIVMHALPEGYWMNEFRNKLISLTGTSG